MTEISGDMTVADGKTTYGDGAGGYLKEEADVGIDVLVEEDSPYPEVRASVSNIDDPEMPALTLRSWSMGMLFVMIGSAVNTFFHFRTPAPYVSPLIVQVVAYPVGKLLAWCLPIRDFHLPRFLGGMSFTLNPGPFNIKEHTVIVIMANVAIGPAYALYATVTSELYYDHDFGAGFSILFVLTTQVTGFAFAGMARRFVVWPASMIWPGNLVVATNLNTFHAEDDGFTGGISRYRFLIIGMGASFAYYFLPGFLFTALSYFSYACWIAPNNRVVNQLFGSATGLGMGILTFDWSQVTWIGSPLTTPWWAEVNVGLGFVLFYWIVVPILYYNNVWQTAYLPMNVIQTADRFGDSYDIFNILTPSIELNLTAYAEYSPIYLSASFSMTYMLAFALSTALIVHTALHHGPRIYRAIINVKTEADDVHMKLMRAYPEVPHWWYVAIFAVCFIMAVVAIEVFHTGLPVWGYILCVILPFIYVIPAAFIYAMTSQLIAINLLAELIPGYIFQGQPIPGMIFKVFSVQTVTETLTFLQDQKLGHYMKIPPRATFFAQLSATSVTCLIQIATKVILFKTVPDICSSTQKHLLTCASTKVFFTSTVVWGLIGPERLFSRGAMFYPQTYAALAGALLPIPLWLWVRRWPRSIFRNVNLPVIFNGALAIPPATGVNYASWLVTGFVFQFWIRRRNFAWWSKVSLATSPWLIKLNKADEVNSTTTSCPQHWMWEQPCPQWSSSLFSIFLALHSIGGVITSTRTVSHVSHVHASCRLSQNSVRRADEITIAVDWTGYGASYLTPPATGFGPDTWKL
ncbi:OPT oligopeptide transporter protein-domain-containing protein [Naematelia encephala]|uniref:OPT oligopeptide transporter protein-domain-containing protein n=1 Tax=Naematelia encephala TaxID=71784 RepID=A0A1Y2ARU8_9TREE|nr:OPT oligopeptide transporter protein-domain-containing protein [Naematelia encephala]